MNLSMDWLGKTVEVIMDRPKHSKHPKYGFEYPVNYGYIPNTISGDGMEIDAYVLKEDKALKTFHGKVVAIIHRKNDTEDKLVVMDSSKQITKAEIKSSTMFQERYFNTTIIL